jgi:hypothetical protein
MDQGQTRGRQCHREIVADEGGEVHDSTLEVGSCIYSRITISLGSFPCGCRDPIVLLHPNQEYTYRLGGNCLRVPPLTALLGSFAFTLSAAATGSNDLILSFGRDGVVSEELSRSSSGALAVAVDEKRSWRVVANRKARGSAIRASCRAIVLIADVGVDDAVFDVTIEARVSKNF